MYKIGVDDAKNEKISENRKRSMSRDRKAIEGKYISRVCEHY